MNRPQLSSGRLLGVVPKQRSAPRRLRAGPLSLLFDNGDLRYVKLGDREIVRRIYVAVRDRLWRTIETRISNLHLDIRPDSFHISYDAEHVEGEIDFLWKCDIRGDANGALAFSMDGAARATFLRNRIGFCVLHPMRECAGARCRVEHNEQGQIEGCFPRLIAPAAPFKEIKSITHEVTPDVWAHLRFTGDLFEMEDQRNWTDASFKTFCTPLRLPYPVEIASGAKVQQTVELRLHGEVSEAARPRDECLSFEISKDSPRPLPAIGLGVAHNEAALAAVQFERLRALRLSHLRLDLWLSAPNHRDSLRRAAGEAKRLGVQIEAALFLTDDAENQIAHLLDQLQAIQPNIARWLVFHDRETVTARKWIEIAREGLRRYDANIPLGSGTNHYFTELNRGQPPVDLLDLVCYSANPQVHAFDDGSLVETLAAQAATVESARLIAAGRSLAITPITLLPRFNPHANGGGQAKAAGDDADSSVDPRQMSLFGAAWTLGSLKYVAESGVRSVTYYETVGGKGVLAAAAPPSNGSCSAPAAVYPLYHVLADMGEFAGGGIVAAQSSDALQVDGLVLEKDGRRRMMLANMTGEPKTVAISSGPQAPTPKTMTIKRLGPANVDQAVQEPESFRRQAGETVTNHAALRTISLSSWEIIRIDWEC